MRRTATKRYFIQSLFGLLIISLWNISLADTKEGNMTNPEEARVLKTVESMTTAFNQKDIQGVLISYEDGAAVIFQPGKPVSDPELLKQMFEGSFQINPAFSYPKGHEIYIANDIALHIAPWVMTGKGPNGMEISRNGLSVAVLRKHANGQWLMVLDNPNGQVLMEQ